jgi:dihydroorotase
VPRYRTAIVNARLLDPASGLDQEGSVLIEDGIIRDFGPALFDPALFGDGVPDDATVIDARGLCLAPGLVDIRVQLREPGEEHKETIESASAAAAAGGVTTMVALPNTDPVIDDVAGVEYLARRAREVRKVKIYTYAAVTKGLEGQVLNELGRLKEFGAVAFTDGERTIADAQVMRRALSYASAFGASIVQHPEEPALAHGVVNEGELATRLGLPGIPDAAEAIMLERDLRLVALTGGRYHAAHVSTAAGVEILRQAKARALPVTCDTAPHYFTLNETAVGDYRTFAKVSPPLRSEADRAAVAAAVADGTIDCIASDHAPHDQDAKRLPFIQAAFGIVGLESLLCLSLKLYHDGAMSLLEALAPLTSKPAHILGLPAGRLDRGARADVVLFDPDRPWRLDPHHFRSKSKNSPFDDFPVQGRVERTIVDGRTIFIADEAS